VYYAEVRPDVSFRDVLVGVCFNLHRHDLPEPFAQAVNWGPGDEETLRVLGRTFSSLAKDVVILIDLAEGTCNDSFARDLAIFTRALSSNVSRIAVFGQERAFRYLTDQERTQYFVSTLDVRGLNFDEFRELVARYHPQPNAALLKEVYEQVSAGRATGLYAKLAHTLARMDSLAQMKELAAKSPEEILAIDEQKRFARLSEPARQAAERLVCFALPFQVFEAQEVFADYSVGLAVRELVNLGLLRVHGEKTYEMHETVRAGLESLVPMNVSRSAHQELAVWYAGQGAVSAQIFHLEKAGDPGQAHDLAREAFVRGEHWAALSEYVVRHQLVTAREVVAVFGTGAKIEDQHLLPTTLQALGGEDAVGELVRLLQENLGKTSNDPFWALAVAEAILQLEPVRLDDLIGMILEEPKGLEVKRSALEWLLIAARRKCNHLDPRTLALFDSKPREMKHLLLPFLLTDGRRDALGRAFRFLDQDQEFTKADDRRRIGQRLHISEPSDTVELLAAIPIVNPVHMLAQRSVMLGNVASLIWSKRETLRTHCIHILRHPTAEDAVLQNAMRVLVFLAEPTICPLCDPLTEGKGPVANFAKIIPALVPAFCDQHLYKDRLYNPDATFEERVTALAVLAAIGADLNEAQTSVRAAEADDGKKQLWDLWFLLICAQTPFQGAIPILERLIATGDPKHAQLIFPGLIKLAELPGSAATGMLIKALKYPDVRIRNCAVKNLSYRRAQAALQPLLEQFASEADEGTAVELAAAITASSPDKAVMLTGPLNSAAIWRWQCTLAMRLRDSSVAERVVTIATDPTQPWHLRRSAIACSGRLPYETALLRILPVVMAERSPLTFDRNDNRSCHAMMTATLQAMGSETRRAFDTGKDGFIDFYGGILKECWAEASEPGMSSGDQAATWLWDRLIHHSYPQNSQAPELILNELHIPMLHGAVLRALRLCERADLIEDELVRAESVWVAMKCLCERFRAERDPDLPDRLRRLVKASPCIGNALLERVIEEHVPKPFVSQTPLQSPKADADMRVLNYENVVELLSARVPDAASLPLFVIGAITSEQCEQLIRLANPVNDRDYGVETYVPALRFTSGSHVVAQRKVTYSGESPYAKIRPAIAAANRFGLPNPWHDELMTGALSTSYVPKFLQCLAGMKDSDRFYEALYLHEDVVIPALCNYANAKPVLGYVDARIVPALERLATGGTDELFDGLCTLALEVKTPEIDHLLSVLWARWTQLNTPSGPGSVPSGSLGLWRGFKRLTEHPRFLYIEGWQTRLAPVLTVQTPWMYSDDISQVLERSPRSYVTIENRLYWATNWVHMYRDEIDRLDRSADKVFKEMLEL
jgi:hypothetical protein